jgi:antitoxin CptB
MTDDQTALDIRLKKLKFRAWRRGFREADLILGPFADQNAGALSPAELDEFEDILEQPDQDLYAWIIGTLPVPAPYDTPLMARICEFRFQARRARTELGG